MPLRNSLLALSFAAFLVVGARGGCSPVTSTSGGSEGTGMPLSGGGGRPVSTIGSVGSGGSGGGGGGESGGSGGSEGSGSSGESGSSGGSGGGRGGDGGGGAEIGGGGGGDSGGGAEISGGGRGGDGGGGAEIGGGGGAESPDLASAVGSITGGGSPGGAVGPAAAGPAMGPAVGGSPSPQPGGISILGPIFGSNSTGTTDPGNTGSGSPPPATTNSPSPLGNGPPAAGGGGGGLGGRLGGGLGGGPGGDDLWADDGADDDVTGDTTTVASGNPYPATPARSSCAGTLYFGEARAILLPAAGGEESKGGGVMSKAVGVSVLVRGTLGVHFPPDLFSGVDLYYSMPGRRITIGGHVEKQRRKERVDSVVTGDGGTFCKTIFVDPAQTHLHLLADGCTGYWPQDPASARVPITDWQEGDPTECMMIISIPELSEHFHIESIIHPQSSKSVTSDKKEGSNSIDWNWFLRALGFDSKKNQKNK